MGAGRLSPEPRQSGIQRSYQGIFSAVWRDRLVVIRDRIAVTRDRFAVRWETDATKRDGFALWRD